MEDILASIRRIINEDPPRPEAPAPAATDGDEVLDLVEPIQDMRTRMAEPSAPPQPAPGAVAASGTDITLEALVRSMLAPLLRQWLDTNLPGIVEQAVRSEVTRITRRD